jgi:hypothetical protein
MDKNGRLKESKKEREEREKLSSFASGTLRYCHDLFFIYMRLQRIVLSQAHASFKHSCRFAPLTLFCSLNKPLLDPRDNESNDSEKSRI